MGSWDTLSSSSWRGIEDLAHQMGMNGRDGISTFLAIALAAIWLGLTLYTRFTNRRKTALEDVSKSTKEGKAPPSYLHMFPPSTAKVLGLVRDGSSAPEESAGEELQFRELQDSQMPANTPVDECDPLARTPTDMTIAEIRELGDFPDYEKLTGVPDPTPDPDFVFERAIPRPYRPLRWKYIQNMSLMKLETDYWLELTNDYVETMRWRREILAKHGTRVLDWRPGTELAAKEIMEMALSFYCKRYPSHFRLERRGDSGGGGGGGCGNKQAGWVFVNDILGTKTVLREHHPLRVLFDNVPEEFMLTVRDPRDGLYYLRGGICLSAVGWTMAEKMDRPLAGIHAPVPDYAKNMAFSMDRFFARMPADRPIQRGSFELKAGRPLFLPPEDVAASHGDDSVHSILGVDDIHFRVDWQTLRRLPLSGAIAFNFRCLFTPVAEFRDERHVPALLHKILTASKPNLLAYKATHTLEHVLLPRLAEWAREQERVGLVERGWEPRTLDASPFFDGWRDKWRAKMARGERW